jgi:hypothetical protein
MSQTRKVVCPHCGYEMPMIIHDNAECQGITVRCKNKKCKQIFEIKINKGKQSR